MESEESLNTVIIIASLVILLFGIFQIGIAFFYHKYYINSKRLDAEKSFREKLDLERNERARIANDLHDGLQNDFVAIKNYVNLLACDEQNMKKMGYFNKLEQSIDLANKNIKNISYSLMPSKFKSIGLVNIVSERLNELSNGSNTYFELDYDNEEISIDENTAYQLYRIIQEITNNLIKHSKAKHCKVSILENKKKIKLIFEDDGENFNYKLALNNSSGKGLLSIKERLKTLNATLVQNEMENVNILKITIKL
ncbi:sensor histidine kinase [Flavobacterium sp.]|uniref:sensor histidine kinase n=1 Tax=Flavobacterium sp. TaxID=239 RepID=UPI0038D226A8